MSEIAQLLKRTSILIIVIGIVVLLIGASGDMQLGSFTFKLPDELTRWIIEGIGLGLILFGGFLELRDSPNKKSGAFRQSQTQKFDKESTIEVNKFTRERLAKAQTIDWMAFAMRGTLSVYKDELTQCLRSNGHIRLLLVNPKADLPEMIAKLGYSISAKKIKGDINSSLEMVDEWRKINPGCKIEIRFLSALPPYRIVIVNRMLDSGFIRLRLFVTPHSADAPTVALTTTSDKEWFTFFSEQFEIFWNLATPTDNP